MSRSGSQVLHKLSRSISCALSTVSIHYANECHKNPKSTFFMHNLNKNSFEFVGENEQIVA